MLNRKHTHSLLIIPLIIGLLLAGCTQSNTTTAQSTGTGLVTESTITDTVESSGSLATAQVAILTWNTSGVVVSVSIKAGNQVKSDNVLMELDSTTAPAEVIDGFVALANAKLALENAKSMSSTAEPMVVLVAAQEAYEDTYSDAYTIGTQIGSNNSIAAARVALEIAEVKLEDASENLPTPVILRMTTCNN